MIPKLGAALPAGDVVAVLLLLCIKGQMAWGVSLISFSITTTSSSSIFSFSQRFLLFVTNAQS